MFKTCTKCDKEYSATTGYFPLNKQRKDNLGSWCRKCICAITAAWRIKNREKCRESDKNYYSKNKEKRDKYQKEYLKTLRGYVAHLVNRIKQRCTNLEVHNYKCYGGRGIRCLFTAIELYDWLTTNSIDPRGLEIHRIDNNGDYTLDNITFITKNEHLKLHRGILV